MTPSLRAAPPRRPAAGCGVILALPAR